MKVQLTAITKSVVKDLTAEDFIIYVARVSNPDNQMNKETYSKLSNYLIKSKHWSPFEHASMTVMIETSRAIAQQILRHRSFSFQEFSQRYSKAVAIEPVELRYQADKNRQNSSKICTEHMAVSAVDYAYKECSKVYEELLENGVAKECARMVLPLATQTTLYMTGNVRSWIHYLQQRCDEHAQKEHRLVANEIKVIFEEQFPCIAEALEW